MFLLRKRLIWNGLIWSVAYSLSGRINYINLIMIHIYEWFCIWSTIGININLVNLHLSLVNLNVLNLTQHGTSFLFRQLHFVALGTGLVGTSHLLNYAIVPPTWWSRSQATSGLIAQASYQIIFILRVSDNSLKPRGLQHQRLRWKWNPGVLAGNLLFLL